MEKGFSGKEIAMRLSRGDHRMFAYLYDTYHHAIYLNASKLISDPAGIEDIVQEVFLKLWSNRSSIDPASSVSGWLYTVCHNLCMDHIKSKLRRQASLSMAADAGIEIPERAYQESQWHLLEEAIDHLSPQKKRVLELCKLEGKSYEEASRQLGISKYTINEYLKDGMMFIRGYVQERMSFYSLIATLALLSAVSPLFGSN